MLDRLATLHEDYLADDARRTATHYLLQAWEEALLDGVDGECVAHAALSAALKELVATHGEEPVAAFVTGLTTRVRDGEFTLPERQH